MNGHLWHDMWVLEMARLHPFSYFHTFGQFYSFHPYFVVGSFTFLTAAFVLLNWNWRTR